MTRRSLAPIMALAFLAAACGGTPSGSTATTAPTSAATTAATAAPSAAPATQAAVPPLTIAVISLTAGNAVTYVALAQGFFDQAGVKVTTLDNVGNNLTNLVVSGQADLGQGGAPGAFAPVYEGKQTTALFGYQGNGAGGFMVGAKNITALSQVKRVGAGGPGTSVFGYCNMYKATLKASWDCVPAADSGTRRAMLLSGQVDAELDVYPQLHDLIDSGQVNVLIDTRDAAVRKQYIGGDFPETLIWGMSDNVKGAKKESVLRFMKAIGMAVKFINTSADDVVAKSLKKVKTFDALTEAQLTLAEHDYRQFNHPNQGYISESTWSFSLGQYAQWGLGTSFDPKNPDFAWAKRVDMSFYDAAIGKP